MREARGGVRGCLWAEEEVSGGGGRLVHEEKMRVWGNGGVWAGAPGWKRPLGEERLEQGPCFGGEVALGGGVA